MPGRAKKAKRIPPVEPPAFSANPLLPRPAAMGLSVEVRTNSR